MVEYRNRPEGSVSKLNTYSDGIKVLGTIGKLYRTYNPFGFFGIVALILAVIAVLFFLPVAVDFAKTGLVKKFPTLIVCGFTMIAAIQSFFAGMELQNNVKKNRQDFEMRLLAVSEEKKKHKLKDEFN